MEQRQGERVKEDGSKEIGGRKNRQGEEQKWRKANKSAKKGREKVFIEKKIEDNRRENRVKNFHK